MGISTKWLGLRRAKPDSAAAGNGETQTLPSNDQLANLLFKCAGDYSANYRWKDAAECLQSAVGLRPGNATYYQYLACAYRNMGDISNAINAIRHSLERDPSLGWSHYHLADFLYLQEESFFPVFDNLIRAVNLEPSIRQHGQNALLKAVWPDGVEAPVQTSREAMQNLWQLMPRQVDIEISSACNYHCSVCSCGNGQMNRPKQLMNKEKFQRTVEILAQDKITSFQLLCIGEPFLNRDIYDIISIALEHVPYLDIVTQGSMIDVERLKVFGNRVKLHYSLDGVKFETYQAYRGASRKDYDKAMHNLELLADTDVQVVVSTLVMRTNEHEIDEITDYVKKLGFPHNLSPIHLSPFNVRKEQLPEGVDVSANFVSKRFAAVEDYEHLAPVSERWSSYNEYKYREDLGVYENSTKNKQVCWSGMSQPWITTAGDVVPCCMEAYYPTIRFGNIYEKPFHEIWFSPEYTRFRKQLIDARKSRHGACKICTCHR